MAIVHCPECGSKVSSEATTCPYCGFSSSDDPSIPIADLVPVHKDARLFIPEAAIIDTPGFAAPNAAYEDLARFFEQADEVRRFAPGIFNVIDKMVEDRGERYLAEFSKKARELIKAGEARLSVDRKTRDLIPQIYDKKTGQIIEKARIKIEDVPADVLPSVTALQTQVMLAEVMGEIKSVAANVEALRLEAQADRFAEAETVWLQLQQAVMIRDSRLRDMKLLSLAERANVARRTLENNFKVNCDLALSKKGNKRDWESSADTAMADLSIISLMARSEYAAFTLLGESDAALEGIRQFKGFIQDNRLDEIDTLRRINSHVKGDREAIVAEFHSITSGLAHLELEDKRDLPRLEETNTEEDES